MARKPPLTPRGRKDLAAILSFLDRDETPTHGGIRRKTKRGKRAVSKSLDRLEKDGWIRRDPHENGCVRDIHLARTRRVVEKAIGRKVAAKRPAKKKQGANKRFHAAPKRGCPASGR